MPMITLKATLSVCQDPRFNRAMPHFQHKNTSETAGVFSVFLFLI